MFRLLLIPLCCATIISARQCRFLAEIQGSECRTEVIGPGMHPQLKIEAKITNLQRFTACKLLYEVTIPRGAFLDPDSLNSSVPQHIVHAPRRFDVEAIAEHSEPMTVHFLARRDFRKTFVLEDSIRIPLHLRYHVSNFGGQPVSVSIKQPKILIDCAEDFEANGFAECTAELKHIDGVPRRSPRWLEVPPIKRNSPIVIKLNVGNKMPPSDRSIANITKDC
ncbi:unnamed protein product, partial [Mesorhabditis spiculigera]